MKGLRYNIFNYVKCLGLSSLILCIGCSEEYVGGGSHTPSLSYYYLKPSKTRVDFRSEGHAEQLEITSEGASWVLKNNASWLVVSPASGSGTTNVEMVAEQHLSGDTSRVSIMALESTMPDWNYSRSISLSQSAATPYLNIAHAEFAFSGQANTKDFEISSNSSWAVRCNADWIKAVKISEGVLNISVDANPANDYRKGIVYISNKSGEQPIEVTQFASGVKVSQTSIQTEKEASLFELQVDSEIGWTATSSENWIQLSPESGGVGVAKLEISTTENNTISERKGYVYIHSGEYQKAQIEIMQKGIYLEVDMESIAFTSVSETKQLSVKSNTDWVIEDVPEWITLSDLEGSGGKVLDMTSKDNNSTMSRSGAFILKHETLDLSCKIRVKQEAKMFKIDQTTLQFGVDASTQPININSGLPWNSVVSDSWITTDLLQGDGDATVNVSVTETQSYDERFGNIKYSVIDKEIVVDVHQLAKYFTVTDSVFKYSSKGGSTSLSFSSNESWTIEKENKADWIVLSDTLGKGDGNVTITTIDNPTLNDRRENLLLKTSVGQIIKIAVTQDARYLRTDTESLSYFAVGGKYVVKIETDAVYKIESSDAWIGIVDMSNDSWEISVPRNTEPIIRQGKITIQVTDLKEGELIIEIPIIQTYEGGIYIDKSYETEVGWDVASGDSLLIKITSFSASSSWDSQNKNTVIINKGGYPTDSIYDSSKKNVFVINKSEYENENEWN